MTDQNRPDERHSTQAQTPAPQAGQTSGSETKPRATRSLVLLGPVVLALIALLILVIYHFFFRG